MWTQGRKERRIMLEILMWIDLKYEVRNERLFYYKAVLAAFEFVALMQGCAIKPTSLLGRPCTPQRLAE